MLFNILAFRHRGGDFIKMAQEHATRLRRHGWGFDGEVAGGIVHVVHIQLRGVFGIGKGFLEVNELDRSASLRLVLPSGSRVFL